MNEQEAIEQLQCEYLATNGTETPARVRYHNEALDTAIAALKEVQEYHDTGHTPRMVRELRRGYINAHKTACQYAIELDEENECQIIPEAWWENRKYNPDCTYNCIIDDKVVAWMPLPDPYHIADPGKKVGDGE